MFKYSKNFIDYIEYQVRNLSLTFGNQNRHGRANMQIHDLQT